MFCFCNKLHGCVSFSFEFRKSKQAKDPEPIWKVESNHTCSCLPPLKRMVKSSRRRATILLRTSRPGQLGTPSFFQIRPFTGLLALGIAFFCIFASLGILLASDGQFVDSWPIRPAVYLAIISAITNTALQIARAQAIPIDWWYSVYRGGTLKELEQR
jgi:hypothetical protein